MEAPVFSFPTIWLSTLERGYGHRRVTIFNFVSTPAILINCVSAHPVLHPGGGQYLVRVVTGYLVGILQGDIQQVLLLLVPTKVNITWYSTTPTLSVFN